LLFQILLFHTSVVFFNIHNKKFMIKRTSSATAIAFAFGLLALSACNDKTKTYADNDPVFKNMDTSVKPGDDFFKYANGTWLKKNPIPPAYAAWGIGNVVEEELRNRMKKINEDALKAGAPKGSNTQKIGDFYFSGMDTVDIEKQGLSPLKDELAKIDQVKDIKGLIEEFAHLGTIGVTTPLGTYAGQDAKNSAKIVLQLGQDGIGLPDRDYYFNTDAHSIAVRNDYQQKHLPTIFKLSVCSLTQLCWRLHRHMPLKNHWPIAAVNSKICVILITTIIKCRWRV